MIPTEMADFELMIEWGIDYHTFQNQPDYLIKKILEYRSAKNSGENRRAKK